MQIDTTSVLIGFFIGLAVGTAVGWFIANAQKTGVLFERDAEGRIQAIIPIKS